MTNNHNMQELLRKRYDMMAKSYGLFGRVVTAHRATALQALEPQAQDYILDLACGPAINFNGISSVVGDTGLLVGVDYSSGMIEQAINSVKSKKWTRSIPLVGDAAKLPFSDEKFDRAICTYSLNVIPNYESALDEVYRVLKKGGILVVLDGKLNRNITRIFNPLVKLMTRWPMSDSSRPLLKDIEKRFWVKQIKEFDIGYTFIAVAEKMH